MNGAARSAGRLRIGSVIYRGGQFSVDMKFESVAHFPGEDEAKSAALAARQHFYRLMFENGYFNQGMPEIFTTAVGRRSLSFLVTCAASKKKPEAIKVYDPDPIVTPGTRKKKADEAGD